MANNSLKETIATNYNNLSRNQKKIADFILTSQEITIDITGKHLANLLDISESTVVRFAQEIGLSGFKELSLLINDHIKSTKTSIERMALLNERKLESSHSLGSIESEITALRKVKDNFNKESYLNAVTALNSADRIYILGCRTSHFLASYFNFYLNLMKFDVRLLGEKEISIIEELSDIRDNDILFTISFPRYTRALSDIVQYVKSKNNKIIVLTDSENNGLVKMADISITSPNNIMFFVDSLIVPMAIINSLIIDLSLKNKQKTINSLTEMEEIWRKLNIFESKENEI